MNESAFCYHCRQRHPMDMLKVVVVRGKKRWRCTRSLHASIAPQLVRDAFGQATREQKRRQHENCVARRSVPLCIRELIEQKPATVGEIT